METVRILIPICVILAIIIGGTATSQYIFNEVSPWFGLIAYGIVAVISISLIVNLIKKHFKT